MFWFFQPEFFRVSSLTTESFCKQFVSGEKKKHNNQKTKYVLHHATDTV